MPYKNRDKMLKKSDCTLPPPNGYPGKYSKDNKDGTLLTKEDWWRKEGKTWVNEMKQNEKYDDTNWSLKADCLKAWLVKTFHQISTREAKEILFDIEADNGDEDVSDQDVGSIQEVEEEVEDVPKEAGLLELPDKS